MFTTNRVLAAPVHVCLDTLAAAAGRVRGVLYNSGCANAVTGERGIADARRMRELGADAIGAKPEELFVLSTGVIGKFLDMEKLARGVATLRSHAALRTADDAVRAIMTTDTRKKLAFSPLSLPGGRVTIAGFAKGAGMIHPNMATMLSVITTDARLEPARLDRCLRSAVERSFNRISVDGDMSTNDTVLVLASGASGRRRRRCRRAGVHGGAHRCVHVAGAPDRARWRGRHAPRGAAHHRRRHRAPGAWRRRCHRLLAARQDRDPRQRSQLGPHPRGGGLLGRGDRAR
jgi:glutamate N-acetyltransferase/amino-acid acetyltransferase